MRQIVEIIDEQSIEEAHYTAAARARGLGFNKLDCNLIASAVSEIATNIIKYAGSGQMVISLMGNQRGLDFIFTDNGPGIKDLDAAKKDGFTTGASSLGVGLGAADRAMDYFDISSTEGKGTTVCMSKWLPISQLKIEYGVVSMPDPNYPVNGDGYVIREYGGDSVLVAVIDGLGEGQNAWNTTQMLQNLIHESHMHSLEMIFWMCEKAIKKEYPRSGASIGLLRIEPTRLSYAGLGDTFIEVCCEDNITFHSQQGVVGAFNLPTIRVVEKDHSHHATIIMCTDGITHHFTGQNLPKDLGAQEVAEFIFRHFRRRDGDATVLVIKLKSEP
jgi:anti-sigma regulatory factor (Ser/Thr protein kinase)